MDKNLKIIKDIVGTKAAENNVTIEKIILFGSRAGKNYDEFSDYDILIVAGAEITPEKKLVLFKDINNSLASEMIPSDIIIRTKNEYGALSANIGTLAFEAEKEGVLL